MSQQSSVNGEPVPSILTAEQVRTLFPHGPLGLRNPMTGAAVMVNESGGLVLEPNINYTYSLPKSISNSNLMVGSPTDAGSPSGLPPMAPTNNNSLLRRRNSLPFGAGAAAGAGHNMMGISPGRGRPACVGGDSDDEVGVIIASPQRTNNNGRTASQQQQNLSQGGGGGTGGGGDQQQHLSQRSLKSGGGGGGGGGAGGGGNYLHTNNDGDSNQHPPHDDDDVFMSPNAIETTTSGNNNNNNAGAAIAGLSQVIVRRGKLIMDRVHDHIMLPPIVCRIIDQPEFQRLRYLKQLGATAYLYPGATHTRFEHSIGVCHLAGLMAKKIARRQPNIGVTEMDILCVMVAGLCHDLGHGPFSHQWEVVVNGALAKRQGQPGVTRKHWHHEEMSQILVRRVFANLRAQDDEAVRDFADEDIEFIVLCIDGLKTGRPWPEHLVNRHENKRFLLDIVANKRNGIDVDKLDYFMRDSLACYGKAAIDIHISRLINSVRAIKHQGEWQICFEEKMALSLGDIFSVRAKLHKYAYQHKTTKVVDNMIRDALELAEPFFLVRGTDGRLCHMLEAVDDPAAFIELGDWILNAIAASTDENMKPARELIHRLHTRQLYSLVGSAQMRPHYRGNINDLRNEILYLVRNEADRKLLEKEMIVEWIKITYGSSDTEGNPDDPINHVTFFNPKGNPDVGFALPRDRRNPLFSPSAFEEKSMLVMVRDRDCHTIAHDAVERWKERNQAHVETAIPNFNSPARRQRELSIGAITATTTQHSAAGTTTAMMLSGASHTTNNNMSINAAAAASNSTQQPPLH